MAEILVTGHHYGDGLVEPLEAAGHTVIRGSQPVEGEVVPALPNLDLSLMESLDAVVVSHRDACTTEMIEAGTKLRGIVSTVIGLDTIDMAAANAAGILVANGSLPENYLGVSEATVMLIAALLLRLRDKERWLAENKAEPRHMLGRMVREKTIGLVGLGKSARGVVARLQGWDTHIIATDPYVPGGVPGVEIVDLEDLLSRADVVSIHVALNPSTHHMIGQRELALMKHDAYLINTSRGPVVDEAALIAVLEEGRIAGAALDVFETEPLPLDSPLRNLSNVILTPHMVGHSQELEENIPKVALENLKRILDGEDPLYVANPGIKDKWRERLRRLASDAP